MPDPDFPLAKTLLHRRGRGGDATHGERRRRDGLSIRADFARRPAKRANEMVDAPSRIIRPDRLHVFEDDSRIEAVLDRARGHIGERIPVDCAGGKALRVMTGRESGEAQQLADLTSKGGLAGADRTGDQQD